MFSATVSISDFSIKHTNVCGILVHLHPHTSRFLRTRRAAKEYHLSSVEDLIMIIRQLASGIDLEGEQMSCSKIISRFAYMQDLHYPLPHKYRSANSTLLPYIQI